MRTMTVSKCRNLRWLEQPALFFRVRLDARGCQMCESASRCLRSVNLERPWGGAGEGAPTLYWSPSKNGERELKLNGSTRLRAAIRAAVSP